LAFACGGQLLPGLQEGQLIDSGEMSHQASLSPRVADEEDVFGLMTVLAQGLESSQVLVARAAVELPDLVAVQTAPTAAHVTAIVGLVVDRMSNAVPLAEGEQLGEGGQARGPWDRINRQTQVCHV